jgi:hypothetical protein
MHRLYSGIKSIALGPWFDFEGVFNKTLFKTTAKSAEKHRLVPTICRWCWKAGT